MSAQVGCNVGTRHKAPSQAESYHGTAGKYPDKIGKERQQYPTQGDDNRRTKQYWARAKVVYQHSYRYISNCQPQK